MIVSEEVVDTLLEMVRQLVRDIGPEGTFRRTETGFEGGQMPLYRRLPKRGFTNINSKEIVGINVSALERFENDSVVSVETLLETGVIKNPRTALRFLVTES